MNPHHFLIVFVLLFIFGCGGADRAGITGTVTLDGATLDNGTIQLTPDDGNVVKVPSGAVIANGKYSIPAEPGVPDGLYTVRISSPEPVAPPPGFSLQNAASMSIPEVKTVDRIPADWNTESTHTIEVKKGRNRYDFNVTTK